MKGMGTILNGYRKLARVLLWQGEQENDTAFLSGRIAEICRGLVNEDDHPSYPPVMVQDYTGMAWEYW